MNELSVLATLAVVHLAALASPGPDFALVVQNASRHGRKIGLAIAMGISLAILVHSILSLTGVSLLIQQQPVLGVILPMIGGGYLLYLGFGALRAVYAMWQSKTQSSMKTAETLLSTKAALLKGFTTNMLNPKALVFFVSLLTTLVPATLSIEGKLSAIALLWFLSLAWFAMLAWLLTGARMQKAMLLFAPYIDAVCGVLFMLVGGGILINAVANFA